ncbi:hypothetical protein EDC14_101357 [Hydrogenispora ethanolica]|jgi:hypothetical protein|uniref:Uncharacterized protein n=1 Tax=Hydrogenispora ethanolica TaxID=1082276 RepID=A0A4V2QEL8_HYDET|nr:hypothetical protein EDC14_101357 [Hydrogenispora ethanolica]
MAVNDPKTLRWIRITLAVIIAYLIWVYGRG